MTFIPVPNVAAVEMFMTAQGNKMENVFHVSQDTPFDLSRLEDACTDLQAWVTAHWTSIANDGIAVVGFKATALDSESSPSFEPTIAEAISGGNTSDILPLNVAAVISWKTGSRGRSYRGRTYFVGLSIDNIVGNMIETGTLGQLNTAYLALLAAFVSDDLQPVVVSRVHNKAPRTTGIATPITSLSVDSNLDSQRRRLNGRGS